MRTTPLCSGRKPTTPRNNYARTHNPSGHNDPERDLTDNRGDTGLQRHTTRTPHSPILGTSTDHRKKNTHMDHTGKATRTTCTSPRTNTRVSYRPKLWNSQNKAHSTQTTTRKTSPTRNPEGRDIRTIRPSPTRTKHQAHTMGTSQGHQPDPRSTETKTRPSMSNPSNEETRFNSNTTHKKAP